MRTLAIVVLMPLMGAAQAREEAGAWRVYRSPRFELLTDGGSGTARAALGRLEAASEALARAEPRLKAPPGRLRILAFSSEKEFEPYRSSSQSPAYFASGPEGGLIVLGRLAEDCWPLLAHEYVHAAVRAAGLRLPLWLEEGLAELYSGRAADPARMGAADVERLWAAGAQKGGVRGAGWPAEFYRHGRQVAHLLRHHPDYAPAWDRLLEGGGNLEAAYGGRAGRIAADASAFRGAYPEAPEAGTAEVEEAQPEVGEVEWTQALALARLGRQEQALGRLEGVETAGAHALAGRILARMRDPRAWERLRQAFRSGTADAAALWQFIVYEQDAPGSEELLAALERLLELEPERDEARMILASHYLSRGRLAQARRHLRLVCEVPAQFAAYYRQALAIIGPA